VKNDELESIWYEALMSRHSHEVTEENHENLNQDRRSPGPKIETGTSRILSRTVNHSTTTVGVSSVNLANTYVGTDIMGSCPGFRIDTIQVCNSARSMYSMKRTSLNNFVTNVAVYAEASGPFSDCNFILFKIFLNNTIFHFSVVTLIIRFFKIIHYSHT
jgi:hypothetical protein